MIGKTFNRLTVLEIIPPHKGVRGYVVCRCSCGTVKKIYKYNVIAGKSRSCGCLNRETTAIRNKTQMSTHGLSYSITYRSWHSMKTRCLNKNAPDYHRYGGRGVLICKRWLDSFENFFADMGERKSKALSLDRINNKGNYEPGNCRWATSSQQNKNKDRPKGRVFMTIQGRTKSLVDWELETGIGYQLFTYRRKRGWPDDKMLIKPVFGRAIVPHLQPQNMVPKLVVE